MPVEEGAEALRNPNLLQGIDVLLVEDEPMARELFEAQRPDVIPADIGMAEEDGYALMRSVRDLEQQRSLPRTPAIAVTAFARTEDRERALAAGFDGHLSKPVNSDRLIALLAQWKVKRES